MDSNTNIDTLRAYETHLAEYIKGTPREVAGDVKVWIDTTLEGLPPDASIFEIGSAFGRDAAYIESVGYRVQRSDAAESFVNHLRSEGNDATVFNLITDEFTHTNDLIFADAVLLHLTRDQVADALVKIHRGLNQGGRFSFSLKKGEGEGWSDAKLGVPRYFCYWQADDIEKLLQASGFTEITMVDGNQGRSNAEWLQIIAS